ncbi:MAG: TonB-dependent receptor [Chloroflexota bacterium]
MCATGRLTLNYNTSGESVWNRHRVRLRAAAATLLFAMAGRAAEAQQIGVSGTVTSRSGGPIAGVTVRVLGTETRTVTSATGKYFVNAPADGTLSFALVGQRPVQTAVGGRTTIDVTMEPIAYLEEVVVTSYTAQRRADITGAVASVNLDAASRQTGASVLQRLDATVPGVTVNAAGSPGGRSTVRIRGISSFQNNDPLYVIDGVPIQDSYINWLNPADITSIQVLKDASAASIYGARASNGVVVIETTRKGTGGPPRVTLRARTGVARPVRGYDDFLILNSLDYFQVVKQSYLNAGLAVPTNIYGDPNNPTVPQFIYPNNCGPKSSPAVCTNVDLSTYAYPGNLIMPGSAGTNWWKAVFGPAQVGDYNLDIRGGNEENTYGVSFNYFDQGGTAKYNEFKRGSVRVNTAFNRNRLNFGENLVLSLERNHGGLPNDEGGETALIGKNILMQPVVPIYDVKGNFASGKSVGLGNNTNPLKSAYEARDNEGKNDRVFGNVFAGFDMTPELGLKSSLGFTVGQGSFAGFNPITPENSEPTLINSINENANLFTDWTLTNTARFLRQYSDHHLDVLVGQAASGATNRSISASLSNLLNSGLDSRYVQDALGDASTKNVFSSGGRSAMLSFFGKADYNYADKYVASVTLRRDGSSRLGPRRRWGTFPAFGAGWRLSKEPFLAGNRVLSDVMLRVGYGVTGNQQIPSGRIVSQFGGDRGDTYYDITGSKNTIVQGFRLASLGNDSLQWEENRSTNVGADIAMFDNNVNFIIDVWERKTNNLLFDPRIPATAGIAAPPIVNVGKMRNRGFDFSVGHRGASWSATFNGSHYKNKIVSINGVQDFFYGPISTRFGNQVINKVGYPIGSFYGYIADGFFRDNADVASHAQQDGAQPGRIKFRDVNGDGKITLTDRTIIGSPHPDFTAGLDLSMRRGMWDLSGTLFGTWGNKIFDVQKEFYVFRNFSTNVRRDLLAKSWTPQNLNAKYPRLDVNDQSSHQISSFYVEDGSYVRLRNLQLGYTLPPSLEKYFAATRVYIQGENLFTITGYSGLDPSLPAANVFGAAGDIRDQYRGVDRGVYPSNRTFSVGLVTSF